MKWGIIATGNIANKFARTIIQMREAGEEQNLVACASRHQEKADEFAGKYGIPYAYGSYESMMENPEVEAVYIATPNAMHYENSMMCLKAGKHVLCEKPFTLHAEEARELYHYAKEHHLFIMEGFWIRFLPALRKMKEIIQDGVIGEVVYARSDYGFIAKGARRERKFLADLGGGALLDIGIYNLGFMRMVMGDEDVIDFHSEYHINEYGTDDFSSILLKYPNGKCATITTCIGMDIPRKAAIYGTRGNIFLDDYQMADHVTVCVAEQEPYRLEYPILMGGFEFEIRELTECVKNHTEDSTILKPKDSLAVLSQMERILHEWNELHQK